jgi:hypothetical protein
VSLTPLLEYLMSVPEAGAVKAAGLQVLTGSKALEGEKEQAWLLAQLDDASVLVRSAAVKAMGARVEGAKRVGQMMLDGKLATYLKPAVIESLRKYAEKDADAARLLRELDK